MSWGLPLVAKVSGGGQVSRRRIHEIDFLNVSSIKALNLAWRKFSAGKKSRTDVAEYQKQLKTNVQNLHADLVDDSYEHGRYQPFTICDPKQRLIHKATVRDRLVHQAVVSVIEPLFEKRFIFDSYSCRVGKGTHAGVARLGLFLRQASRNLRYCDDFAVVSTDKRYLDSLIEPIRQFLAESLQLELHPTKVSIRSWDQGIDFLGYVLRPHATSLRTKTKKRMLKRVHENNSSSYRGLCSHANAYHLSQTLELMTWRRL